MIDQPLFTPRCFPSAKQSHVFWGQLGLPADVRRQMMSPSRINRAPLPVVGGASVGVEAPERDRIDESFLAVVRECLALWRASSMWFRHAESVGSQPHLAPILIP